MSATHRLRWPGADFSPTPVTRHGDPPAQDRPTVEPYDPRHGPSGRRTSLAPRSDGAAAAGRRARLGLAERPRRAGTPPRKPAVVQTQVVPRGDGRADLDRGRRHLARAFGVVGIAGLIRYRAKSTTQGCQCDACRAGRGPGMRRGLLYLAIAATGFLLRCSGCSIEGGRPYDGVHPESDHRGPGGNAPEGRGASAPPQTGTNCVAGDSRAGLHVNVPWR